MVFNDEAHHAYRPAPHEVGDELKKLSAEERKKLQEEKRKLPYGLADLIRFTFQGR